MRLVAAFMLASVTAGADLSASEPREIVETLNLPAAFVGTLPCGDCAGIEQRVDLWPDGVFYHRRIYLDEDDTLIYDFGRWHINPNNGAILLYGDGETPLAFAAKGSQLLQLLDGDGEIIESSLYFGLERLQSFEPMSVRDTFRGMFSYFADAAQFQECRTGQSYPVVMQGEYLAMEQAYLGIRGKVPGAQIMAALDGLITAMPGPDGSGQVRSISVERFDGLSPGQTCQSIASDASLTETRWRLLRAGAFEITQAASPGDPHIVLQEAEQRIAGDAGCNRFAGGFVHDGYSIGFTGLLSTKMACQPPWGEIEQQVLKSLDATVRFAIEGDRLELFDTNGVSLALFEADSGS